MVLDRFEDRIDEVEKTIKEMAIDITTGTFVDKLSPEQMWESMEDRVKLVGDLVNELREYLYMLKPERVPSIQRYVTGINERLSLFEETLRGDEGSTQDDSKESVEELRQALVDITEFISFCRLVKTEPSETINEILVLRANQATDVPPMTQERMRRLGDLVRDAQVSTKESTELLTKMGGQLEAVNVEYERLLYSLKKKEE